MLPSLVSRMMVTAATVPTTTTVMVVEVEDSVKGVEEEEVVAAAAAAGVEGLVVVVWVDLTLRVRSGWKQKLVKAKVTTTTPGPGRQLGPSLREITSRS